MRLASFIWVKHSDNKPTIARRPARYPARPVGALVCASLGLALSALAGAVGSGNAATAGGSAGMTVAVAARPVQSLAAVARRAEDAVREALPTSQPAQTTGPQGLPKAKQRITAREPDPRLRLAACPTPLDAALPVTTGGLRARTIVQVSCRAPSSHWTVLVPVSLETDTSVLVAARNLSRGQVPRPADVQLTNRTLPGISTIYISNLNEIRDQHLIRPLDAGQPLTRDALAADPVVRRGEAVTLVADVAGVEVRMPGRALADAQPGHPVRVQNVNSLKIVEGRADEKGMVRVDR